MATANDKIRERLNELFDKIEVARDNPYTTKADWDDLKAQLDIAKGQLDVLGDGKKFAVSLIQPAATCFVALTAFLTFIATQTTLGERLNKLYQEITVHWIAPTMTEKGASYANPEKRPVHVGQ